MRKTLYSLLLATAWVAWFGIAFIAHIAADQSSLSSPTTGTVSGLQLTNNYNSAINALNTCNSGSSAPTNQLSGVPSLGNCWLDTSSAGFAQLKFYDGASWLLAGVMDLTNHVWIPQWGGANVAAITLASASTTDLCGSAVVKASAVIAISGTTTITSFGSSCAPGQLKYLAFTGSLTLTNSSTLLLNGGVNISVQSGDSGIALYTGSGWVMSWFSPTNNVSCSGVTAGTVAVRNGYVTHC